MSARISMICAAAVITLVGCSTVGRVTVKPYVAKNGERVFAGQAAPKADYQCSQVAQDKQPWGLHGNMDRVHATEQLTASAVDEAPAKGANYVYVMVPGEASIGSINVNAFKSARVAYFSCSQLPVNAG